MSAEENPRQADDSGLGRPISRRLLLKGAAGVAGAAAARSPLVGGVAQAAPIAQEAPPPPLRFLTQFEFNYVTAMAETIWPTDDLGPGARVGGVGHYIDGQLAGSWGQGHRLYRNGPFFAPETSGHGWQIPMTPADVYRAFLPGFDVYCKTTFGKPYPSLTAAQQTQALTDLQTGKAAIQIGGSTAFTSADFFSLFRQNVLEGMLADPAYGGNRNMVGWKWIGFPGDPMRRGDEYFKYIFTNKPYPFEDKPLPLMASSLKVTARGAAASPKVQVPTDSDSMKGGM
jgi:gluconate 2-dehydrogenase gamma chain